MPSAEKRQKGLRVSSFALLLVVFKSSDIMAIKGLTTGDFLNLNLKSPLASFFLCVYASPHLNFRSREPVSMNMVRNYASGKPSNSLSGYNLLKNKNK